MLGAAESNEGLVTGGRALAQVKEFRRSAKDLGAVLGCLFHYIWSRASRRRRRRGGLRPRRCNRTAWASSGSVTHRNVIRRSGPPRVVLALNATSPLFSFAKSSITVRGASPRPAPRIQPASVFHST